MGSGAEPRPKTVLVQFDLQRSPLMTANASPVLKSGGYGTPSPKVGVLVPLIRYAYAY